MNNTFLIGNLTRNPDMSTTNSGIQVCKFSIAVNRNFSNANGEREVDFFNIVVWRTLAENCGKYLNKGNKVAVRGRLENRSYEGKDGVKKTVTEVIADEVEFLTPKGSAEVPETDKIPAPVKPNNHGLTPVESDDLPF